MVVVAVTVHILLSFPSASNALREVLLALRLSHYIHLPVSFGFLVSIPGILRQCLYIPPGYPPPASKFCMLPLFFFSCEHSEEFSAPPCELSAAEYDVCCSLGCPWPLCCPASHPFSWITDWMPALVNSLIVCIKKVSSASSCDYSWEGFHLMICVVQNYRLEKFEQVSKMTG